MMKLKYLLILFVLIFNLKGYSQISSDDNFFEETEYSDSDFVFVFCTNDVNGGSLIADDSTGFGGYNFEWYKYNEGTNDFTDVLLGFTINIDSTSSTITNLANGGYKVILTNVDTTQEYVAWVYNNTNLSIELKLDEESDCDYMGLWGVPDLNTSFNYYDVSTGASYELKNRSQKYYWYSDPDLEVLADSSNHFFTSLPNGTFPLENTRFKIVIKDKFGCFAEDELDYTAIETKADLSWTSFDDKTGEELENGSSDSDLSGPAPLQVKFTNESINGQSYIWFFGDTLWNNDEDTVKTDDFYLEPEHTYYYTVADSGKTYILRLFSESEYGCVDSLFFNIKVEPSLIEFPNVFTPFTTIGQNDVFILIDYQSIRSFKITIFNRVGQVVHEYEGDVRDWEGWDGTIRTSNREAPAGNYFFVTEVLGWDNVTYHNNNQGKNSKKQDSSTDDTDPNSTTTNTGTDGPQFGVIRLF